MTDTGTVPSERRRLAEAAAWRVHLAELEAETSESLEAWLVDPRNRAAWEQVQGPWDALGEQATEPGMMAARQAALRDAERARAQRQAPAGWRRLAGALAAALVLGLVVWCAVRWLENPDEYATALGERRMITLADGSRISLDSSSDVTVSYSKNARELQLLRGQARFDVAHDVERPFSVLAGDQKVIATGTAFNIDMAGPKVLVTLIEGHVVVLDEKTAALASVPALAPRHRSVELHAGQQLAALPDKQPAIAPANIQRVTAWQEGQLMFDNEPLSSVVARVNRYTATPLVIHDPKVAAMRISGVFYTGDIAGFVDIVTHYLPVAATDRANGAVELRSKN